jgi:hypothetical protein
MKALFALVAGIALIAGFVATNLWNRLHDEQLVNEQLRAQLEQARIAPPAVAATPSIMPVLPAPTTAATPGTNVPAPSVGLQTRAAAEPVAEASALASRLATVTMSTNTIDWDLMETNPEYRKARLTQARLKIEKSNPGLADALGLSERDAEKFFELLATNELANSELATSPARNNRMDFASVVERSRSLQNEQEEAIKSTLGAGKYQQWRDYQALGPARQQVTTMGNTLAAAGAPLSDAQSEALNSVMIAEVRRQRQQPSTLPAPNPGADSRARATQLLEDASRRVEENSRHTLEAVSPHLNAAQVTVLREQFDRQFGQQR